MKRTDKDFTPLKVKGIINFLLRHATSYEERKTILNHWGFYNPKKHKKYIGTKI